MGIRLCVLTATALAAVALTAPAADAASIRVPLDRDHLGLGRITVRYAVFRHTDRSQPPLEPIVAFEGGPGYGSIGSASTYLFMLGKLHRRHDLIVMDQRGTGSSGAIDCPALQAGIPPYAAAAAACARRLGRTASAYGTGAVADDMAAILRKLHVPQVDVYGDSYGTYAAQVFAVRHPNKTRAVVVDAAFDNSFDPVERESSVALRSAWRAVCVRVGRCPNILGSIGSLARRLAAHPIVGTSTDADGVRRHVRLGPVELGSLVYDATYTYTVFRDLPGALVALRHGDRAPMLRLAAEDVAFNLPGGSPSSYSVGDYQAVACHDYPTVWSKAASPAARRATLANAIRHLSPNVFAPFSKRVWLRTVVERELVRGCLDWPQPKIGPPPFPGGGARPTMPVLVLNGEFDQSTPVADAQHVATAFPNATLVEVPNTGHVSALYDFQHCASRIVRRFLSTLATGSTACATAMPPVNVAAFPRTLGAAPEADGGRVGALARRAGWVATETIGDALARWYNLMYTTRGHGLRGGSYTITGGYLSHSPLSIRFAGTRLVSDMAVSGRAVWDRRAWRVHARLRLSGAATGVLDVSFTTDATGEVATISGRVEQRTVHLQMPAPWAPQG
ncbi:MAG: alpha/beta fold hydrolase [Gaiellales bacterium]